MSLSNTILRGTDQMYDAGQGMVRARVQRRARQRESLRSASEAFADIGKTIKDYGSFQKARQEEDDIKGVREDALLGFVTRGPAGGITALTKRPHLTSAGFEEALKLRGQFDKSLQFEVESELNRLEHASKVKRDDEIVRHNKQLESYYKTLSDLKSKKEQRDAETAEMEGGEDEAIGAAFQDEDPRASQATPDGMVLPTERSPEDIARRIGKSGKVSPKGMSQVAPFISAMQRPDLRTAQDEASMARRNAQDDASMGRVQVQELGDTERAKLQIAQRDRVINSHAGIALADRTARDAWERLRIMAAQRGQDMQYAIANNRDVSAEARTAEHVLSTTLNTLKDIRAFDPNLTPEQEQAADERIRTIESRLNGLLGLKSLEKQVPGMDTQTGPAIRQQMPAPGQIPMQQPNGPLPDHQRSKEDLEAELKSLGG